MRRQGEESRRRLADGIGFVCELLSSSGGGKMARTRDTRPFLNEDWFLLTVSGGVLRAPEWAQTAAIAAPADADAESQREHVAPVSPASGRENRHSHTFLHPSPYVAVLSSICGPVDEADRFAARMEVAV
jgi:hypothetical protein